QVNFTEATEDGKLRHPVYMGLREDKSFKEVKAETETPVKTKSVKTLSKKAVTKKAATKKAAVKKTADKKTALKKKAIKKAAPVNRKKAASKIAKTSDKKPSQKKTSAINKTEDKEIIKTSGELVSPKDKGDKKIDVDKRILTLISLDTI